MTTLCKTCGKPTTEHKGFECPDVSASFSNELLCGDKLQIIYEHNRPYGIRDSGGYLFFFAEISKFSGQEERYRKEIEQQYKLANYLLAALKDT